MAVGEIHKSKGTFGGTITVQQNDVHNYSAENITQLSDNRPELTLPKANTGGIIPYVIGGFRINAPNIIWAGNTQPILKMTVKEEQTVKEQQIAAPEDSNATDYFIGGAVGIGDFDPFSGTWVTKKASGYSVYEHHTTVTNTIEVTGYRMDIALALCLGPEIILNAIRVGDVEVWRGNAWGYGWDEPGNGNHAVMQNGFLFYGGYFDQQPSPYILANEAPENVPGYVGISYIIFKQVDTTALNGAALSFELQRLPDYLGLGDKNVLNWNDINPATAMVDLIINDWGALGLSIDDIDLQSFVEAGELFHDEGQGVAFASTAENFGSGVLAELQEQTRSIIFANPNTGKISVRPLRALRYFHSTPSPITLAEDAIVDMQYIGKSDWLDVPTYYSAKFFDRDNGFKQTELPAKNPSVPPVYDRSRRIASITFPAIATADIAQKALDLLMTYNGEPRLTAKFQCTRAVADCLPGDVIFINWSKMGLTNFPMFIQKIRETDAKTNQLVVECEQNDFQAIIGYYRGVDRPIPVAVDLTPKKIVHGRAIDTPYWLLKRYGYKQSYATPNDAEMPLFLVRAYNNYQTGFVLYNNENQAVVKSNSKYSLSAKLAMNIGEYDGFSNWKLPRLTIRDVINPHYLMNVGIDGVKRGTRLMFINDEILGFESFVANSDGSYTLNGIHRGLIDTVPGKHTANDYVTIIDEGNDWFLSKPYRAVLRASWDKIPTGYFGGVSRVFDNVLKYPGEETTYDIEYTPVMRSNIPNRPTLVTINGERDITMSAGSGEDYAIDIDWFTRSRAALDITLSEVDSEAVEKYDANYFQTYAVYFEDVDGQRVFVGASGVGDMKGRYPARPNGLTFDMDTNYFSSEYGIVLSEGQGFIEVVPAVYDNRNGTPGTILSKLHPNYFGTRYEKTPLRLQYS